MVLVSTMSMNTIATIAHTDEFQNFSKCLCVLRVLLRLDIRENVYWRDGDEYNLPRKINVSGFAGKKIALRVFYDVIFLACPVAAYFG